SLRKKDSEAGSSAPVEEPTEDMDDADLSNFCTKLEDSMERNEGTSSKAVFAPPPRFGFAATGFFGNARAKTMRHQLDPLDTLACSALPRDKEYDNIPNDGFAASRSEEINLTLFPLAPGSRDLDQTITVAELRRTESLLLLELSNRFNVLSALLVSHGFELNSHYAALTASKARSQDKLKHMSKCIAELHAEVSSLEEKYGKVQEDRDVDDAGGTSAKLADELAQTDAKLYDQALIVRDLEDKLIRESVLSSDEFNFALARVLYLGITFGVERGLRMGRTDAGFEEASQNVLNFFVGAQAEFDKAVAAFPSTRFPFLDKIIVAAGGALPDVANIQPDRISRLTTPAIAIPSSVSKVLDQSP
ncbi:hypothetical protein Tco_0059776, partial [Tanacetum coccineum]